MKNDESKQMRGKLNSHCKSVSSAALNLLYAFSDSPSDRVRVFEIEWTQS
jgi:hypothetical protein